MVALKGISLSHLSLSRSSTPANVDHPKSSSKLSPPTSGGSSPVGTRPSTAEADIADTKKNGLSGALGASIRRSASFRASAPPMTASTSLKPSTKELVRPTSDTTTGLQARHAPSGGGGAPVIGRRITSNAPSPLVASTNTPVLGKTHSQPGLSRLPASAANGLKSLLPSSSNTTTKTAPTILTGASTPLLTTGVKAVNGGPATSHTLTESFIEKVSMRLGEAVNRVFLPGAPGAPGTEGAVVLNGRSAPNRIKAREVGELIVHELHSALHDIYLLRTILRSSVLKSLSLFLTRITALLLPPSASTPFLPPLTIKEVDTLPIPTRYNLAIVRSAYEMKAALRRAGAGGAPAVVEETLRPWVGKLDELMSRVMGPLVEVLRKEVARICSKARIPETTVVSQLVGGAPLSSTTSAELNAGHGLVAPPTAGHGLGLPGAASLRSLSLGRTASNSSLHPSSSTTSSSSSHGTVGPAWIKELLSVLDATSKFFNRMECGRDAEKWLVGVGTCVAWKGMLALSARNVTEEEAVEKTATTGNGEKVKGGGLFKNTKRSPSPPTSPLLFAVGGQPPIPSSTTSATNGGTSPPVGKSANPASDLAFVRLLCELELFETRLSHFVSSSLTLAALPSPHHHDSPTTPCSATTCPSTVSSASPFCGLCKTGRTFDGESSDSDDDDDEDENVAGLAQYAMREAMQALSAMILVVRASFRKGVLEDALRWEMNARKEREELKRERGLPLTPSILLDPVEAFIPSPKKLLQPPCSTLVAALDTLPTLLFLHLVASRVPRSVDFRLPHELWELDWSAYEVELRGFRAAEEWKLEIGWEMKNEARRAREKLGKEGEGAGTGEARERLELVELVVESKIGGDGE